MTSLSILLLFAVILANIYTSYEQSCGYAPNQDNGGTIIQTVTFQIQTGLDLRTACCQRCQSHLSCRSWTYDFNTNNCFLKSNVGSLVSCNGSMIILFCLDYKIILRIYKL